MSQVYVGNGNGGGGPSTDLHVARFIVSAGGTAQGANYTTIASAYAAAVSVGGNQTVFIQPGVYNENLTLTAGICLTAFDCDADNPNVTINGKMTGNITGNCSFSGIYFNNNGDNILEISGAGASIFRFTDSFISVGGTAFAIENTNPSCGVIFEGCQGDISGTSAYFDFTGGGVILNNCFFFNGVNSTTQNIFDNAAFGIQNTVFDSCINATDTGGDVSVVNSTMIVLNATVITTSGGPNADLVIYNSHIDSNNATAIDIGAGSTMTIANSSVGSNATDAIVGAGTLRYSPIAFTKSSSSVTVAVQTPIRFGPQISPELVDTNGTVYYDGTIISTVDPGTAGDVLTSNGAGSPPSYQSSATGPAVNFSVYLSANTATTETGDGTIAVVPFDTVLADTNSAYSTVTNTYTVPVTGFYQFNFNVFAFRTTGVNTVIIVIISVNGSPLRTYELNYENIQVSGECILNSGFNWAATAGDTFQVQCQVGGVAANIGFGGGVAATRFSGYLNR